MYIYTDWIHSNWIHIFLKLESSILLALCFYVYWRNKLHVTNSILSPELNLCHYVIILVILKQTLSFEAMWVITTILLYRYRSFFIIIKRAWYITSNHHHRKDKELKRKNQPHRNIFINAMNKYFWTRNS